VVNNSVSMYGIFEVLKKESGNVFSFDYYISYDVLRGSYGVSLWVVSENGGKGLGVDVIFRII
jgi:hypothetical protein